VFYFVSALGNIVIQSGAVWFGSTYVNLRGAHIFKLKIEKKSLLLRSCKCGVWPNFQVLCNSVGPVVSHSCNAAEVLRMFIKNGINIEQ
jgi:hypothetical protein